MTTLLFCHGLESGPWGRKSLALKAAGHEVIAPDSRGRPLTDRVGQIASTLRDLQSPPLVVGSSFGGLAGLLATMALVPEGIVVPGLLLCAPALHLPLPPNISELWPPTSTLILHGRNDRVVPIEASRTFARHERVSLEELDDDHSLARSTPRILQAVDRLALEG